MAASLSLSKVLLLAAHLAATANIQDLSWLITLHPSLLHRDLVLRILLTYLPETVRPGAYIGLLQLLVSGRLPAPDAIHIDTSRVINIDDADAARRARRLRLLPLDLRSRPATDSGQSDDILALFLIQRALRVDDEIGTLSQLPGLFMPFLERCPTIRTWAVSVALPLSRRNCEYYHNTKPLHTLRAFEALSDVAAVSYLLSETGTSDQNSELVGRDINGLLGPWLQCPSRWKRLTLDGQTPYEDDVSSDRPLDSDPWDSLDLEPNTLTCPGWQRFCEWLVFKASDRWKVAVSAFQQWRGPEDFDLGPYGPSSLSHHQLQHLRHQAARAAAASAYLIPEAGLEGLDGAHYIATKLSLHLGKSPLEDLASAARNLHRVPNSAAELLLRASPTLLRTGLMGQDNILTVPCDATAQLLHALILSAHLLTRLGNPCSVRKTGDLILMANEREQKQELRKCIHMVSNNALKNEDSFWAKTRLDILWLHSWGQESPDLASRTSIGVFCRLSREFIETEILNALLASSRLPLARSIYEDSPEKPLGLEAVQDTIFSAALHAYDNASNLNRTKGGLKKCDDIVHAFPASIKPSLERAFRIEALLSATHALRDYRLVLKQGELFRPVFLRVHPDPVSIIGTVFEQNPKIYPQLSEFVDIGANMVRAGLVTGHRGTHPRSEDAIQHELDQIDLARKRITAMSIKAALREADFETAYSFVTNKIDANEHPLRNAAPGRPSDDWSWSAAYLAGQYVRTDRSLRPTHLGTATGNLDVRHLEHSLECLATALRIAPAARLQEILDTFRSCEKQLTAALYEEQAQQAAWDDDADRWSANMPGGFVDARPPSRLAGRSGHAEEDAPMSLFDLSRATARLAHQNLAALTRSTTSDRSNIATADTAQEPSPQRTRRRDQLRDAAMDSIVSSVGWLINAQPSTRPE